MKHSTSFERVTPEMAKELLTYNTHNRPVSQAHVTYLADEISQGRFMPTSQIHIAYDTNGAGTMINGQHVSMAIIKANKTVLMNIVRTTNCTPEEQAMLYIETDIQRKRTFSDSAIAYRLPERMNAAPRTIKRIAGALRFIAVGFGAMDRGSRSLKLSDSVLFEHVPRWAHEAQILELVMRPMAREFDHLVFKAPIYSIALLTMFYQPERAKEFWSQVAKDDGVAIGDPRKTLHLYLPKTKRMGYGANIVPTFIQARAASYCWNAFWDNRPLTQIQMLERNAKLPMVLRGTSYSGNQAFNYYPHRDPNHGAKPNSETQRELISPN